MNESCSQCQIILAEDNPADVGLVRAALRQSEVDCQLHVFDDGEKLLALIDGLDGDSKLPCPDLFLLDLHLPKHDGHQVLTYLRASERCARTPVVVLTSSDSPSDRQTAEKNATLHYFQKPVSLDQFMLLGAIVKEVIDRRQSA